MRASATILTLMLALLAGAGAAHAQETVTTPPESGQAVTTPDYSEETLLRVLRADAEEQERRGRLNPFRPTRFEAFGTTFDVSFFQLAMPLSGSGIGEWADPFALTQTQIAMSPRAWRTQRQVSAELRRINNMERARIRVDTR